MKFINLTKNTIYLSDIDKDVPFLENSEPQQISLDDAKKSDSFRRLLTLKAFKIIECGDSLFERNLLKLQEKGESMVKFTPKDNSGDSLVEENVQSGEQIEVKLRGHFYELGGYSKVNRNLALGLNKLGVRLNIDPVNRKGNQLNEDEVRKLAKINKTVSKNAIIIESVIPTFGNSVFGKYRILYTTVEAETVPAQFVEICNSYNEVWVTSDFCKKVLLDSGLAIPIFVVPDSVDVNIYNENCEKYQFNPPLNSFVFVGVFGWSYRKGYDVLLKSYLEEFDGDDDVSLLIVSRNHLGFCKNDIIKNTISDYIKSYGGDNPAHIARCSKMIPESDMPSIYKACNAFVLFSRGEGFGLPFIESSLCGLPVIGTNCSGQSMFLKKSNSYLLDPDEAIEMQPGQMQVHYWDGQKFPSLMSPRVIGDARKLMRHVYENYDDAKNKNRKLSRFIADNYSIEAVSNVAYNRLASIWRKL